MAQSNRTAINVNLVGIPAHVAVDCNRLRGKGFVGFDQVKVGCRPARLFKRLFRRRDRTRPHDRRIDTGRCPAFDGGKRGQTALGRLSR